jgi:hypothetical protein
MNESVVYTVVSVYYWLKYPGKFYNLEVELINLMMTDLPSLKRFEQDTMACVIFDKHIPFYYITQAVAT